MGVDLLTTVPERRVQIELWRFLKGAVEKKIQFNDIEFFDVKYEEPSVDGRPDLVVYARERGKEFPILVIETKRKVPYVDSKFDPFSKDVIGQAEKYATWLGAPYFATCNGEILVLFETFKIGVPLPQRKMKDYRVSFDEPFVRTLLEEVGKFRIGIGKWLPLDDVFLQRLRYFHRFLTPFIHSALTQKLADDRDFRKRYTTWLRSQLFEFSPEMNEKIAEEAAYLLMNKIAFYKTLETFVPNLTKLGKVQAENGREFSIKLREYFDTVVSKVDYEPIFRRSDIFDEIQLPTRLVPVLNDFIEELGTYNLASIQSDVLGRVYEELIPADERHRLGQYYTPPPVVELITAMCIESSDDKVLDPGCGSGSFLVKAYYKLKELKQRENPLAPDATLHKGLLSQLYGIDINQFPASLSAINLAVRNLKVKSDTISILVSDFFKVSPSLPLLPKEGFDVVITNPPYTRQEEMEYKQQIRDVALTYTNGSKIDISAQAGIYVYFFTHSAKFLKNGGRMGYITSNTWLDVGFGEGLRKFFLDNFKIRTIIEFDAAVFEKADVNTCIVILEKAEGSSCKFERNSNVVRFVRLKRRRVLSEIIQIINEKQEDHEDDEIRVVCRLQNSLFPTEKWSKYLRAPSVCFKVTSHVKMTKLGAISEIRRGFTTGADKFFYLDRKTKEQWGIERQYLKPVVISPRDLKFADLRPEDITDWVLMVHEDKQALARTNVLQYIERGENAEVAVKGGIRGGKLVRGYHNLSTMQSRKLWYDLGKRKPAAILFPKYIYERSFAILNKAEALADQDFVEIQLPNEKDTVCVAGILNSTITGLLREIGGRSYKEGVQGIAIYEIHELPLLDPQKISAEEKTEIEEAFLRVCHAKRIADKNAEEEALKKLDNVVFDVLGLTKSERRQIYEGLNYVRRIRRERKAVEVFVETAEAWEPSKKSQKKERMHGEKPSKRLEVWMN